MTRGPGAGLLLLLMVGARTARAADPHLCGSRPWVQVSLPTDLPPAAASFVDLLRVELAARGLDVCEAHPQGQAVATIEVVTRPGGLMLNLEVRDALTAKRVSRDIDLGAVPPDGQPLMVALASDELLRASWAELALRAAPPPARPVPPAVDAVVRDSVRPADRERVRLGVVASSEHYSAGTTLYGADIVVGAVLTRRLSVDAGFGLRTGPNVSATDGATGASTVGGGLSARFTMTPPDRHLGLDGVARFELERASFTAVPRPGAVASSQSGYPLLAEGGVSGWFRVLPRVRVSAEILASVPLRSVYVTDGPARAAGVAGVGVGAGVGVWSTF